MLRIDILRGDSLGPLIKPWGALCQRAGDAASVFQGPDWCVAWATEHDPDQVFVAAAWDGDELLAVLPLYRDRDLLGLRCLRWLGGRTTGAGSFPRAPGCDAAAVLEACLARLRTEADVAVLALTNLSNDAEFARTLGFELHPAEARHASACTLGALATVWDAFGPAARRSLRRSERRLQQRGELRLTSLMPFDPNYQGAVDLLLSWKQTQLSHRGRSTRAIRDPRLWAVLQNLGRSAVAGFEARIYLLELDGQAIAGQLGLLHAGRFSGLLMAFELGHRGVSPGALTTCYVLEHLKSEGVGIYDLLGHPEPYKEAVANLHAPLWDAVLSFTQLGSVRWDAGRALRSRAKHLRSLISCR